MAIPNGHLVVFLPTGFEIVPYAVWRLGYIQSPGAHPYSTAWAYDSNDDTWVSPEGNWIFPEDSEWSQIPSNYLTQILLLT